MKKKEAGVFSTERSKFDSRAFKIAHSSATPSNKEVFTSERNKTGGGDTCSLELVGEETSANRF